MDEFGKTDSAIYAYYALAVVTVGIVVTVVFGYLFFLGVGTAKADETVYGDFQQVTFHYCYDGDTCTVSLPNQHPLLGDKISIRLASIDTPEKRGKCTQEKQLAKKAADAVNQIMKQAHSIQLKNTRRGKYFRIVAEVIVDGVHLNQWLVENHLAVPYQGGRKTHSWCS